MRFPATLQVGLEPDDIEVKALPSDPLAWKGDLLVLGVFEEAFETKGAWLPSLSQSQ
jgi:hypothetical protein